MENNATAFAIAGAFITAVFFGVINYMLTPGVVWFIYPLYAIMWWPLGVYMCGRKKYFAFSVAGSLMTIAFLAATNYFTSPGALWFVHAIPPLLCWPMGVYFKQKLQTLGAALIVSTSIIAYYLTMNLLLTPGYFWAIYPIYAVLWWPLSVYFTQRKKFKEFSIAGSAMTVAFLAVTNLMHAQYPWAFFACYPLIWWPIAMYFGKRLGGMKFSIIASACTILWYGALNIWLEPGSPWIMFVVYPTLWWVLSVYFAGRKAPHWYAAVMTAVSLLFFGVVNLVYSPAVLWAHYPVYAMLWWPMTLFFARGRKWFGYSVAASLLTIVFLASVNLLTSPGYPWSMYPALAIIWWPLSVFFTKHKSALGYSIAGSILVVGTLVAINLLTSPGFLWSLIPAACIIWWPMSVYFAKRKSALGLSIAGSIFVIAALVVINLLTSTGFMWSVFPSICVLWWPVSVFFAGKGKPLLFSVFGSLLAIGLLGAINLMTSPGFLWFLFPTFAVLWWPLGVGFGQARKRVAEKCN